MSYKYMELPVLLQTVLLFRYVMRKTSSALQQMSDNKHNIQKIYTSWINDSDLNQ